MLLQRRSAAISGAWSLVGSRSLRSLRNLQLDPDVAGGCDVLVTCRFPSLAPMGGLQHLQGWQACSITGLAKAGAFAVLGQHEGVQGMGMHQGLGFAQKNASFLQNSVHNGVWLCIPTVSVCCDHTIQNRAPLIRTGNSTWIGLHQYWVEGSPGNPECCSAFWPTLTCSAQGPLSCCHRHMAVGVWVR